MEERERSAILDIWLKDCTERLGSRVRQPTILYRQCASGLVWIKLFGTAQKEGGLWHDSDVVDVRRTEEQKKRRIGIKLLRGDHEDIAEN
jgi:hypothetical protein